MTAPPAGLHQALADGRTPLFQERPHPGPRAGLGRIVALY